MKAGDQVQTILGAGRIQEVRNTPSGIILLVVLQEGGFGRGYTEVFSPDEVEFTTGD